MQPIFNCSLTTGLYCLFLSQVWFLGLGYQYLSVCNRMQTSGQLHWAAISLCCSHRTIRCSVYTRKMEGYRGTSVVIAIINLLWKTYEGELPPSDNTSWCCWMGLNFGLFNVFFFFSSLCRRCQNVPSQDTWAFPSAMVQGCSYIPREKYPGLRDADPATSSKYNDIFKSNKAKPQAFWAKPAEWQGFARVIKLKEDLRGTLRT